MPVSRKRSLIEIFESSSEDEDFRGFNATSLTKDILQEGREYLHSVECWKADPRFRSKFITKELAQIFMASDGEEEFKGFSKEDCFQRKDKATVSEEDSDVDTGFYSEEEEPSQQRRRSSGLCVAFRFPSKTISAQRKDVGQRGHQEPRHMEENRKKRRSGKEQENPLCKTERTKESTRSHPNGKESAREVEGLAEESQTLNKRARNIQENKAMLAKLFADLSSLPELSPMTTPTKKKQGLSRKRTLDVQSERRNPARKARPPEHFGREERSGPPSGRAKRLRDYRDVDVHRLVEVDQDVREGNRPQRKRYRKRHVARLPEDITEEELMNVAYRSKDKIHDKENGSTCHQCRQKTLDTKTECRSPSCVGVKGQFCGPCLRNRYGEDVGAVLLDPTWECPICRGVCNCSLCRKRDGRCATGAVTQLAKFHGHSNVKEYLESLQKQVA